MEHQSNNNAREAIFKSIRANLAASQTLNARELEIHHPDESTHLAVLPGHDKTSLVDRFKESLEAVEGHCIIVQSDEQLVESLTDIITRLQSTYLRARRIAISDSPEIERLVNQVDADVDALAITPSSSDIFNFDVGISCVQAGIAETGTLVLDSSRERNRWVSLVPPVHIAILDAAQIVLTLGEALSMMQKDDQVSPIVTLVTGPSRTADIELTLAIGVHGPQEVYVIVRDKVSDML
jgi:L-lactate dehydrogenase complex protein LldG